MKYVKSLVIFFLLGLGACACSGYQCKVYTKTHDIISGTCTLGSQGGKSQVLYVTTPDGEELVLPLESIQMVRRLDRRGDL